ncbi:MAG: ATP-binding cassette domain-containing protein [Geminicoccaceae bacterium]
MATLSLDVLAKWFPAVAGAPAKRALGEVSLAVDPGRTLAIIGPSGCGKTSLLNIAAGLDPEFEGRRAVSPDTRLAYVFQEPRLLPWRSVEQNLEFVLHGVSDAGARIDKALHEVELDGARKVYASRLSLGMARRAALARAFVLRPTLLFLDEPFVSLDEPTAQRLRLLLLDLLAAYRAAALFVTHALDEAIMLADHLLFLSASPGRLLALRPVELSPAERRDPGTIAAFRARLLAEDWAASTIFAKPEPFA